MSDSDSNYRQLSSGSEAFDPDPERRDLNFNLLLRLRRRRRVLTHRRRRPAGPSALGAGR